MSYYLTELTGGGPLDGARKGYSELPMLQTVNEMVIVDPVTGANTKFVEHRYGLKVHQLPDDYEKHVFEPEKNADGCVIYFYLGANLK